MLGTTQFQISRKENLHAFASVFCGIARACFVKFIRFVPEDILNQAYPIRVLISSSFHNLLKVGYAHGEVGLLRWHSSPRSAERVRTTAWLRKFSEAATKQRDCVNSSCEVHPPSAFVVDLQSFGIKRILSGSYVHKVVSFQVLSWSESERLSGRRCPCLVCKHLFENVALSFNSVLEMSVYSVDLWNCLDSSPVADICGPLGAHVVFILEQFPSHVIPLGEDLHSVVGLVEVCRFQKALSIEEHNSHPVSLEHC